MHEMRAPAGSNIVKPPVLPTPQAGVASYEVVLDEKFWVRDFEVEDCVLDGGGFGELVEQLAC